MSLTAAQLLTASDVAERWQIPVGHVYRLTRTGQLPTVRMGRYCRYTVTAIEAFEAGGGTDEHRAVPQ